MKAAFNLINEAVIEFQSHIKERQIELALREVPAKIREIREKAFASVFSKEISGLTEESKEVLERVVDYMEKKCVSIPMQVAKEKLMG
jgi:glutamyl-tRNA reductase